MGVATTTAAAQKVVKYCCILSLSSHLYIPSATVYFDVSGTPDMIYETNIKSHQGAIKLIRIVYMIQRVLQIQV